jgi:predicted lipoprotein with Yx(FWY)xxD motif
MESYSCSMTRILPFIASIGCAVLLTACGDDSPKSPAAATEEQRAASQEEPVASTEAAAPAAVRGPLVKLGGSQFGPVLFDGTNQAIYTFTRDRSGDNARSRCFADCAEAWPPVFAKARPRAGRGVKRALLGTIRRGRRRQVTYRGQPLYFYAHEGKRQVLCNNIVEFGGTWYAVTAEGRPPA